ncbi:hypothetical protein BT96DRAFT_999336 [Gymnopus androsaceus JB14]|uniref:Uncharacterized protein n=1 Tax=Gymnopus androsaceus JB14 TaxID=1447944 RepID=A0A6A4H760_9AGAR|nr:hypothetical protein BT96DRAFT_999336 [Gymnopus androsaceus JB14]
MFVYSARGLALSSRAFFQPGMLALLYFSAEHTPLFAISIIPVLPTTLSRRERLGEMRMRWMFLLPWSTDVTGSPNHLRARAQNPDGDVFAAGLTSATRQWTTNLCQLGSMRPGLSMYSWQCDDVIPFFCSSRMANDPPTFFQLARELRDQIYDDALLSTTVATPPESIPPYLVCIRAAYRLGEMATPIQSRLELDLVVLKTPSSPDEDSWYCVMRENRLCFPYARIIIQTFNRALPPLLSPTQSVEACAFRRIQSQVGFWWWGAEEGPLV